MVLIWGYDMLNNGYTCPEEIDNSCYDSAPKNKKKKNNI